MTFVGMSCLPPTRMFCLSTTRATPALARASGLPPAELHTRAGRRPGLGGCDHVRRDERRALERLCAGLSGDDQSEHRHETPPLSVVPARRGPTLPPSSRYQERLDFLLWVVTQTVESIDLTQFPRLVWT